VCRQEVRVLCSLLPVADLSVCGSHPDHDPLNQGVTAQILRQARAEPHNYTHTPFSMGDRYSWRVIHLPRDARPRLRASEPLDQVEPKIDG